MSLSVFPLDAALGAEIVGLDLTVPLSNEAVRALRAVLFEHSVIIIRGQTLTADHVESVARCFGRPQPHIVSHLRLPDHPAILLLSNIVEGGTPIGIYDGAAFWHTDMSYEEDPALATIVYCVKTPKNGGDTLFASMYRAWADLPANMKQRVEGLTAIHHYGNRDDPDEASNSSAEPLTSEQRDSLEVAHHPVVRPHPVTGKNVLYGVAGASHGIVGMPRREAIGLLNDLKLHATRPEYVYRHRYSVGDLVVWDNASTLHTATPIQLATCPDEERLLYRISCKAGGG